MPTDRSGGSSRSAPLQPQWIGNSCKCFAPGRFILLPLPLTLSSEGLSILRLSSQLKCKWESELVQHMVMTFAVLGAADLCAEHGEKRNVSLPVSNYHLLFVLFYWLLNTLQKTIEIYKNHIIIVHLNTFVFFLSV